MKCFLTLLLLISTKAFAGLPPTSLLGSGDANPVVTFQTLMPFQTVTHTGTSVSFGALGIQGGGTNQTSYGSNGQCLVSNGSGSTTWGTCGTLTVPLPVLQGGTGQTSTANMYATNTSNQSIANSSGINVTGWTTSWDHGKAGTNFVASTGVYTVPYAGTYSVCFSVLYASAASGSAGAEYDASIVQTGSVNATTNASLFYTPASYTGLLFLEGCKLFTCAASDTLRPQVFQASGGARLLSTAADTTHLSIYRVGD